jgi:hypothetical protein
MALVGATVDVGDGEGVGVFDDGELSGIIGGKAILRLAK